MPVAVIAVSMLIMLVVVIQSDASPSCISRSEVQYSGSMQIYWPDQTRCSEVKPMHRFPQDHKAERNRRIHEVQRNIDQQESMSEMLSDNEPAQKFTQTPWINREPSILPLDARWLDTAQNRPPSVIERKPEPMVSQHVMLLAFIIIAIGLTLATIELLFRRTVLVSSSGVGAHPMKPSA
jgi:hypothetical protein